VTFPPYVGSSSDSFRHSTWGQKHKKKEEEGKRRKNKKQKTKTVSLRGLVPLFFRAIDCPASSPSLHPPADKGKHLLLHTHHTTPFFQMPFNPIVLNQIFFENDFMFFLIFFYFYFYNFFCFSFCHRHFLHLLLHHHLHHLLSFFLSFFFFLLLLRSSIRFETFSIFSFFRSFTFFSFFSFCFSFF